MDNFKELKKALASKLAENGDYSSAVLLIEEEKKREKREKIKIVARGGTNTNVVKKMIDTALAGVGAGVSDHGALTGLADDDHTQYHNNTRGDARYFTQSQVTTSLSGKADTVHTHVKADITDFSDADYADAPHTHAISDTTGLQTALDGKADDVHAHVISDTTGLQTALDGKAATSHAHIIADVTGLQTALDGKTATGHTHSIGDVSGLGTELADKLDASHISDTAYDATSWNAVTTIAPSKNAVRDKIETMDTAIALNTAKVTNATHTGDATGSGALTVVALNGTTLSGLATGILKNTTGTGVPSIAVNSDLPVMTATIGGAVPTPPNNTTTFLRGDGTFATPSGGSGDMVLASTQTNSGLKTFLSGTFGLRNAANTFTSLFTNTATAARTWTLKDADGTIAFTSDITGTNSGTNTGDQSIFQTIVVSGQSNVVADTTTDTLTLVAGTNVTITTDAGTDAITINATGGGNGMSTGLGYAFAMKGNFMN
jgi:hypothetical protein